MTKHPVEQEELQAFLDKELAPPRQAEVGHHIQDCRECTAMIADLQKVSATLQQWQVAPAPANLKRPVIREDKTKAPFSWVRLALTLSGGAAVVLLLVAISIPNLLRSRMAADKATQAAREREGQTLQYSGAFGTQAPARRPQEPIRTSWQL